MNPIRHLALIAALLAGLPLTAACSAKMRPAPDWDQAAVTETRWSATYTSGGEAIPLTLILMTAENFSQARLVALSAFGVTLGDCRVENGRGQCRSSRGAEGLMTKISGAIGTMLELEADFLLKPDSKPGQIGLPGWQAQRDADGQIEYRPAASSSWSLAMKKMATK